VDTARTEALASRSILGSRLDALTYDNAVARILSWGRTGESRYVCVAAVNNVMTGHFQPGFRRVHNEADLVTTDGMPLVWGLRLLGLPDAERVYGPELMPRVCEAAAREGVPIGLYGGAPDVLEELVGRLTERFPGLEVAYAHSPPFRPLTEEEDRAEVERIRASEARILFVGMGCPKQEEWMARHRPEIPAVMIGVGAAFDFLAGRKPRAPRWMQRSGLEWLFRLASEPRRLWRRYAVQNPLFVALFGAQLVRGRWSRSGRGA
jgi:N-acetylglucosaminyldiphosphoundecaprenol N-acetyl-beta-D-mannosaminyltransferase